MRLRPVSTGACLAVASAFVAVAPPAGGAPAKPVFDDTAWALEGTAKLTVRKLGGGKEPEQAIVFFDTAPDARIDVSGEGVYEFTWRVVGGRGNRVIFSYEPGSDALFNERLADRVEAVASQKLGAYASDMDLTAGRTKVVAILDVKRDVLRFKGFRAFTARSADFDRTFRGKYSVKGRGGRAAG